METWSDVVYGWSLSAVSSDSSCIMFSACPYLDVLLKNDGLTCKSPRIAAVLGELEGLYEKDKNAKLNGRRIWEKRKTRKRSSKAIWYVPSIHGAQWHMGESNDIGSNKGVIYTTRNQDGKIPPIDDWLFKLYSFKVDANITVECKQSKGKTFKQF